MLAITGSIAAGVPLGAQSGSAPSSLILYPPVVESLNEGLSLSDRLRDHGAPAVSVALLDAGRLEWARAWGTRDANGAPATAETAFQAASLTKPATAMVTMLLWQSGRLDLDADVNEILGDWQVTQPDGGVATGVTIRHLLSHSAGVRPSGFEGYTPGSRVPSLVEILDGATPSNSESVRAVAPPGEFNQYSGGGYMILQKIVERVAQSPYAEVMNEEIFSPLGMRRSAFGVPETGSSDHAVGFDRQGNPIEGGWNVYPESAAAGLWTTPSDYAKTLSALYKGARSEPGAILQPNTVLEMLTVPPTRMPPLPPRWGLGWELWGEGEGLYLSHTGANAGYRARAVFFPDTGQGAVVMTNSDRGGMLIDEVMRGLAVAHDWPDLHPRQFTAQSVSLEAMGRAVGSYRFGPGELVIQVTRDEEGLWFALPWTPRIRLIHEGSGRYLATDGHLLIFEMSDGPSPSVEVVPPQAPAILGRRETGSPH